MFFQFCLFYTSCTVSILDDLSYCPPGLFPLMLLVSRAEWEGAVRWIWRERERLPFLLLLCWFYSSATKDVSDVDTPFLDAPSHLYKSSCLSVRPLVPCYFRRRKVCILGTSCAVYPALFSKNFVYKNLSLDICQTLRTN